MNAEAYEERGARQRDLVRDCEWAVLERLLRARSPGDLLEIGCRHAQWLNRARSLGFQTVGLDPAPAPTAPGDPPILTGVAEAVPLPAGSQDVVVLSNAIYCLQDRRQALREMARVLRPGGRLLVLTSNRTMAVVRLLTKYGLESPRLLVRGLGQRRGDMVRAALCPPAMTPDCASVWSELRVWRVAHWRSLLEERFVVEAVHPTAFFTFPDYRLFIGPRRWGRLCSSVVLEARLK